MMRAFLAGLDPADRNMLVYIHGFNTSFDDAQRRAAQLGFDLKVPGITALYSWPSRGNLIAYLADCRRSRRARSTSPSFSCA